MIWGESLIPLMKNAETVLDTSKLIGLERNVKNRNDIYGEIRSRLSFETLTTIQV